MFYLVIQNKYDTRKLTAIFQVITTLRSCIITSYPKVVQDHAYHFGYVNIYTFMICTRE